MIPMFKRSLWHFYGEWMVGKQMCGQWDQVEENYREPKRDDTGLEWEGSCGDGMT